MSCQNQSGQLTWAAIPRPSSIVPTRRWYYELFGFLSQSSIKGSVIREPTPVPSGGHSQEMYPKVVILIKKYPWLEQCPFELRCLGRVVDEHNAIRYSQ